MPLDLERGQATLPDHETLRLDRCLNRYAALLKDEPNFAVNEWAPEYDRRGE